MDAAVEAGQLGYAVHQLGDFRAETPGKLVQRHIAVLDHVMQQRCGDGLFVKAQFGQVQRDFQGMGDVGVAGHPHLPVMAADGEIIGVGDQPHRVFRQIGRHPVQELVGRFGHGNPESITPAKRIRHKSTPR